MTISADKVVSAYIAIRDARAALKANFETEDTKLKEQQAVLEQHLLEVCKSTGTDGGKTKHGTFTRGVQTRYWTSDWDSMRIFIREHDAFDLLEQRLHQTNTASFLKAHPDQVPPGLNVDSKYTITVRRAAATF